MSYFINLYYNFLSVHFVPFSFDDGCELLAFHTLNQGWYLLLWWIRLIYFGQRELFGASAFVLVAFVPDIIGKILALWSQQDVQGLS